MAPRVGSLRKELRDVKVGGSDRRRTAAGEGAESGRFGSVLCAVLDLVRDLAAGNGELELEFSREPSGVRTRESKPKDP